MDQWERTEHSAKCEDRLVLEIVCFTSNRVTEKALSLVWQIREHVVK